MSTSVKRPAPFAAAAVALALLLTGCAGGATDEPSDPETTEVNEPEEAGDDTVNGHTLTAPGTALEVGESAYVAWEPQAGARGALQITVDVIAQARTRDFAGWQLDEATQRATPYFVISTVTNIGDLDLGGISVPLYLENTDGILIQQSEFREQRFEACPSETLPEEFLTGAELTVCQVYLVPDGGEAATMTFRPTQDFEAITWAGQIRPWDKVGKKARNRILAQLTADEESEGDADDTESDSDTGADDDEE
ncbi:hypothetical protein [Nocardioides limicola]|uniref:hypothetical protein n=1 Tax=Nocardioides limicola TaxID=2803368 RepID=UPI00193BE55D|nr:hypothetical protein [Nocardioides sp. DJM-14]